MRIFAAAAVAFVLAASPLQAETEPPAPSIQPIALGIDGKSLSGPGAEILREEMGDAQFVMIGEDHGFAGSARLVESLAGEGAAFGIDHYAIEVGPYSTAWLRDALADGGPDALAVALEGRALALPFMSTREEAEAAMLFLADGRLWGVDQEFIGSPLIHFDVLASNAPPEARAILAALSDRERQAFATGDQGAVFMMAATDEEWAALQEAFANDPAALARLAEIKRSSTIYRHWMTGRGLDNNLDRIALMRENFLKDYHSAEAREGKPPRVLMKFGAVHASRATTPMNTFDLGALVEGMAAANDMEALHIAYFPIKGTQLSLRLGPDGPYMSDEMSNELIREVLTSAGVDLTPIEAGEGHYLIPMEPVKRALGNEGLAELSPMARFVVLGFDYLITTMEAEAATPLALQ